jgi:hypothetical protein
LPLTSNPRHSLYQKGNRARYKAVFDPLLFSFYVLGQSTSFTITEKKQTIQIDAATDLKCKRNGKTRTFSEQIVVGVFIFCKIVLCFAKTIYLHATFLYHNQLNTTLNTAAVFVLASNWETKQLTDKRHFWFHVFAFLEVIESEGGSKHVFPYSLQREIVRKEM